MSKENPDDKFLLPFLALIVGTEENKTSSKGNPLTGGCIIAIAIFLLFICAIIS